MKSSQIDLEKRGFLEKGVEIAFENLPVADKLALLKSNVAKERSLGARLLSKEKDFVTGKLIDALKIETKLYPKIEICKALESHKNDSVVLLIKELGQIGTNQHLQIPEKEFGKDNFPLPRDIAARTLAHIGKSALPALLSVFENDNINQLSEAIDAIGFICFYDCQPQIFEELRQCYIKNKQNDLICWKIVRALSGFSQSLPFLLAEKAGCKNERIKKEINRSIRLIEKREN